MRHATLILTLTLILVGCATDDLTEEDWSGGPDEGDVSTAAPTHNSDNCPGGGGGGEPSPIPAPRDCTREPTWEQCYDCCDWNSKHVWEETCRRILKRKDRAACWRRVENELRPKCYENCNRPGGPITTVAP
jgi:hypothetical protein